MVARHVPPFARVYGIYPCTGGFAFALVEARGRLLDAGKVDLGADNDAEFVSRLQGEISRCLPCALAVESYDNTRRVEKSRRRVTLAMGLARQLKLHCVAIDAATLRASMGLLANATRHEVAAELGRVFLEIAHRVPKRSIWKRDPRIHVFMALGLAWVVATGAMRADGQSM